MSFSCADLVEVVTDVLAARGYTILEMHSADGAAYYRHSSGRRGPLRTGSDGALRATFDALNDALGAAQ